MKELFRKLSVALTALILLAYSVPSFATETEEAMQSENIDRLATTDDIWRVIIIAALVVVAIGIFNIIRIKLEHRNEQ